MDKTAPETPSVLSPRPQKRMSLRAILGLTCFVFLGAASLRSNLWRRHGPSHHHLSPPSWPVPSTSPYGTFPNPSDPFHFLPCTSLTVPPSLDDPEPDRSWAGLFDPDPDHWNWGSRTGLEKASKEGDPYAGRGIYLCGYLTVPLDYTNKSDPRIARLAVTKFEVAGLELSSNTPSQSQVSWEPPRHKAPRTIVLEPGGPGGSGTRWARQAAEAISRRLSDGQYDVLGWDPRGVNTSQPAVACYPHDALRGRWRLLPRQYREVVAGDPDRQLALADAFYSATFRACWERHGDLGRFVSTAFVARDMEAIRAALGEDELTGYLTSYGTGIGQTYANMFPHRVGRMVLDGTEYVKDHRLLGGFGWTALDNATDAWRDGFIGECVNAGPAHCALARLTDGDGRPLSPRELEDRVGRLITSLIHRPVPAYTETTGPSLITYSALVQAIYEAMYRVTSWPALAQLLYELAGGNSTLAAAFLDEAWEHDPSLPCSPLLPTNPTPPRSDELSPLVICADAYDAPSPPGGGLAWWASLWANMTAQNWIAGNARFFNVLPCRHFTTYWPEPAEVYRGDLNHTLRNPVLLVAQTHDPATPLRNGRRLLREMGRRNARLVVHHGYGHMSSADPSDCTDGIARRFILNGTLPDAEETKCYANGKPYLSGPPGA
ncbi:Alpha/Beta hydrolase protein [Parachaetomium inaequale]|uniref:Alpha/Beta hydrolase protein n=1 Tax=Parachaetomium inaequale TaxID=2588326 RepID=A0AAN6SM88_9PEZI|nr:Alpha/Beta hydrolase protein [Parachaetomium inaequale]